MKKRKMKERFLSVFMAIAMVTAMLPAAAAEINSSCGENAAWSMNDNALTISGTGAMTDYTASTPAPWYDVRDNIETVAIESGIISIGTNAFSGCGNLSSIIIPGSVISIESNAFRQCNSLSNVTIPNGVVSIGDGAFGSCEGLISIDIPGSVEVIGRGAFQNCNKLNSANIADSVKSIGPYAFSYCPDLQNITIPDNITIIDEGVFAGCSNLRNITIPDGITSISTVAFEGCPSLTGITIPDGVTDLGLRAFSACTGLTGIDFRGDIPSTMASDAFVNTTSLQKIRYPYGAAGWDGVDPTAWGAGSTVLLTAYGCPALQTSATEIDPDENGVASVTITSRIPFDAVNGADPANYEVTSGNFEVSGAVLADDSLSVTLELVPIATQVLSARAGNVAIAVKPGAFISGVELENEDGSAINANGLTVSVSVNETATPDLGPAPDPAPDPDPEPTPDPEPEPDPDPDPAPDPEPSYPVYPVAPAYPSVPGKPAQTSKPDEAAVPESPSSPLQGTILQEGSGIVDWIDRLRLPEYARTLYDVMSGRPADGSAAGITGSIFEDEYSFVIRQEQPSGSEAASGVELIEIVEFSMRDAYSNETGIRSTIFEDENFYTVAASDADKAIDYSSLRQGDLVRSASFSGLYITKIPRVDYDAKKKEVCEYIAAVYHAFDMDCPEIFWLSGKCKTRIMTVTDPTTKNQEAYFFLVLADDAGFDMRAPAWTASGSIASGILRRDAAVQAILATVTSGEVSGQIKQLNQWLTEHNQYNTTPDLTTIGNEPHECLSALEGRIDTDGPVCDGYSRAMKVLCGKLGIPCILETGWAKAKESDEPEFHMWNDIQVGNVWYGADITWNDPFISGFVGAKSGKENENYLLVGRDTVIRDMKFSASHVVKDQVAEGGVDFNNGPVLSATAFAPVSYGAYYASLFDDVPAGHWAEDAIAWAGSMGYMTGMSAARFGPDRDVTREQIWTVLARMDGKHPEDFDAARAWAMQAGITDGSNPASSASRQELLTLLHRKAGAPSRQADLTGYRDAGQVAAWAEDAVKWAVADGIVAGTSETTLGPEEKTTRAQFALILQRFCRKFPK